MGGEKTIEDRVRDLEYRHLSADLQLKQVFDVVKEIKDTLKKIADEREKAITDHAEIKHISESLTRIEGRLDDHEKNTPKDTPAKIEALEKRIGSLEENRKWLITSILGAFGAAISALVLK